MELVFQRLEKGASRPTTAASATVVRGKVTAASPSFAWAVGEGIHVLLSYAAMRNIRWWRRQNPGQRELFL